MTTLLTVAPERDTTGAVPTVPVGRCMAERLCRAGEGVRVLAPPSEQEGWPPGADVVVGDVTRPERTPEAFVGIDRMFLAGAVPETAHSLVSLARRGGVRRIAVLSSHGPEFEIQWEPESWYWLAIEVVVERSGAEWTHIRPSPLMVQTLSRGFPRPGHSWVERIRDDEVIYDSHTAARVPFIDEDDLAAVAVAVLSGDGYAGRTMHVYGDPISSAEQLESIGAALGRPVRFEELSPEQARVRFRAEGMPEEDIDHTLSIGEEFLAEPMAPNPTVEQVLGRRPRSFAQWLADNAGAFR
ncbi:NAD(P)H-binding protein [Nocardiopsis mwathae]|nr:NAD(P)H-binding protein [Nocardiopsis mwathae]